MYRGLPSFIWQLLLSLLCTCPFLFQLLTVGEHGHSTLGLVCPCFPVGHLTSHLCVRTTELFRNAMFVCLLCTDICSWTSTRASSYLQFEIGLWLSTPLPVLFSDGALSQISEDHPVMQTIHLLIGHIHQLWKPETWEISLVFFSLSPLISSPLAGTAGVPSKIFAQSFYVTLSPMLSPNPVPITSDLVSWIPFFFLCNLFSIVIS